MSALGLGVGLRRRRSLRWRLRWKLSLRMRRRRGGSAYSSGGDNVSGTVNDFHVASNWSRVGMGRGKGSPVRAV